MICVLDAIAQLLFPPKCILCRKVLEAGEIDLCKVCRADAPAFSQGKLKVPSLDSYAALWYYESDVRRSLIAYKFYGQRSLARSFGRLLALKLMQDYPDGFDAVTWVPVSWQRKFRRGYDQVELLAKAVSAELQLPCIRMLKKTRNNRPQSGFSSADRRRANVLGVYRAVNPDEISGKRILLMDDIMTTGATLNECARVLQIAGAGEVHGAVVAAVRKK